MSFSVFLKIFSAWGDYAPSVLPLWVGLLIAGPAPLVLLEAPEDPALLERILGQTLDLPARIEVVARRTPAGAQLAGRKAQAILQIDRRDAAEYTVTIIDRSGQRVSRTVKLISDKREEGSSANLEAVALVVRSTLQAKLAVLAEPAPAPPEVPPPSKDDLRLELALGWSAGADGQSFGPHGPQLRVAMAYSIWRLGLLLGTDLKERLDDEFSTIDLFRYRVGLQLGVWAFSAGPFRLGGGLSAGSILIRRQTVQTAPMVQPTPQKQTFAFFLGLEGRLGWVFSRLFMLELAAGADAVFGAPSITYETPDGPLIRAEPWPVQPLVKLSAVFLWL